MFPGARCSGSCSKADDLFVECTEWIEALSGAGPDDAEATLYEPLRNIMLTILRAVSGEHVATAMLQPPASSPAPAAAPASAPAAPAITSPVAHRTRSSKNRVYARVVGSHSAAASRPTLVLLQQMKAHSAEAESNRIPDISFGSLSLICEDASERAAATIVSPRPFCSRR